MKDRFQSGKGGTIMGYTIIFETKIIKLKDGRLLHLDLSGCNNDTSGRDRGDFTGKIYTKKEFLDKISSLKSNGSSYKECGNFELKIRSRYCTSYDYGTHLERMWKRAETWEEFDCIGRYVGVASVDGADVWENDNKNPITMSLPEFVDYYLKNIYAGKSIRYLILKTPLETEESIVKALDEKKTVTFYIGKLSKCKTA